MEKQIVYYSFISKSDYRNNQFIKTGPFLTVLNQNGGGFHPNVIAVQYSKETEGAKEEIEKLCKQKGMKYYEQTVDNISDFDNALENLYQFLSQMPSDSIICCNISSGTVQFKAALIYLAASKSLPNKIRLFESIQKPVDGKQISINSTDIAYAKLKKSTEISKQEFSTYKKIDQIDFLSNLLKQGRFEEALLLIDQQKYPQLYLDIDCLCSLLKGIPIDKDTISKTDYYDQIKDIFELTGDSRYLDKETDLTWIQFMGYLLYQEQLVLEKLYNIHNILMVNVRDVLAKLHSPDYPLNDSMSYKDYQDFLNDTDDTEFQKFMKTFSIYRSRNNDAHYLRDEKGIRIYTNPDKGIYHGRITIEHPKSDKDYKQSLSKIEERIEQESGKKLPRLANIIDSIKTRIATIKKENLFNE